MTLLKEIRENGLCYRLQILDDTADEWLPIATYFYHYYRIIPILIGLKDFPKELREKIFEENVRRTFEERYYLDMISKEISYVWQMEKYRLFFEKMEDYAQFIQTVSDLGIDTWEEANEINDFFDETYDYLLE
jgi:hypothetical protein